jgi:TolB protein
MVPLTRGESIDRSARPVWSPGGDGLAFVSGREGNPELYVLETNGGGPTRITFNEAHDHLGDWSPDGQWLVFYASDANSEPGLWLRNPSGVNLIRLTQGRDTDPVWSPDGEGIAFVRTQDGNVDVYLVTKPDAGTWRDRVQELRLTLAPEPDIAPEWSPDSDSLVFVSYRDGNAEIYTMRADGARQQRLTNNGLDDLDPVWSPDGRKIAFVSYLYGPGEIFVTDADGSNQQRLTNTGVEENSPDW